MLSEQNFANFPLRGRFLQIMQICRRNLQQFATTDHNISDMITNRGNSRPIGPSMGCSLSIFTAGINSTQVIPLDSRLHTKSIPSKFVALIVYLFIASWSIYRLTSAGNYIRPCGKFRCHCCCCTNPVHRSS